MQEMKPFTDANSAWYPPDGITARLKACLSPQEKSFFDIELGERTLKDYEDRLRCLGFEGRENVLDLACGMGQWTIALGRLNGNAVGVDKAVSRLMLGSALAADQGAENVSFAWSRMEKLAFPSASFDGVFCYGAFMFGRRDQTLSEMHRLLRPGGLLYLNANGLGWYLSRLQSVLTRQLPAGQLAGIGLVFAGTLLRRQRNRAYSLRDLRRRLERAGFAVMASGPEGHIGEAKSFYPGSAYGLDAVFEFVCQRR